MYSNFRLLILVITFLISLTALSEASFNVNNVALKKTNYTTGEVISFQSHIRALSDPGAYTIEALIKDDAGKTLLNRYYYGKTISTTTALQLPVFSYTVPNSISGKINYYLMVWKTDYSKAYAVNQTKLVATIGAVAASSFIADNKALSKSVYKVGENVSFNSNIRSTAGEGVLQIEAIVLDANGKKVGSKFYYSQNVNSVTAKVLEPLVFKVPDAISTSYSFKLSAYSADWSKKYPITQTARGFTVEKPRDPASEAHYKITAVPLSTPDYAKGASISFAFEVSANLQSAKVNIECSIVDLFDVTYSKHVIKSVAVSSGINDLNVNYVLPTTLPIGRYKHRYRILSEDGSKIYSLTQSSPIVFNVGTYQPSAPAAGYPSTLVKLKPRLTSNPLTGGGFIPDTSVGYTMIMNDEFNGTQLDTTKWWTRFVHPKGYEAGMLDTHNDECQRYVENGTHVVSNGTLKLVARPTTKTCRGRSESYYKEWESGMLRSKTLMKYGYFEMRVKMPSGVGVWPAFWLYPENRGWPPEIDIFEYVVNGSTDKPNMIHSGVVQKDSTAQGKARLYKDARFFTDYTYFVAPKHMNFNNDFHVISGLWNTDDTFAMYIDGVPISQLKYKFVYNNGGDAGLAHVLINLAMGGKWPTAEWTAKNMTTDVQKLEIDYVRVYQRSDAIKKGQSVIGRDLCPSDGGC